MKKIIFRILPVFLIIISSVGCSDFLDVNNNENDPTSSPLSNLLTSAEKNIADGLAIGSGDQGGLGTNLAVYVHQMSTRENADQYGVTGNEYYINLAWTTFFRDAIKNLDVMIADGTSQSAFTYVGIAKILKAYTYSQLVDVFGDVPFSEYNKFKDGITNPKFDDDALIYDEIFKLLDEGIADIQKDKSVALLKPAGDDLIYSGSGAKWVKASNTIKLKLYNQVRKVKDVSTSVKALLGNPASLISSESESFLFPYGPLAATDDRHPGFGDYTSTQRGNHISPWFYEILKGYNTFIYTGIADPRLPYYVYNQMTTTSATQNPAEYRDGGFQSIYFGSVGQNRDHSQQSSISLFGIYPVGGRYDDGAGGVAGTASGTGAAPYRFITYADRLYIEAELIQAGLADGDVSAVFKNAVTASISQVDYVVSSFVKPTQTVPKVAGTVAATDYITAVSDLFNAADNTKKLEYIMTQKWLSNVGSTVDQYTDYRRTGYPLLFDPTNQDMAPGGFVKINVPGTALPNVPVQLSNKYPLSLPWSQTELELNSSAPDQKDPATYKVFWQQ